MTLEDGLALITQYKRGLEKFLEILPQQEKDPQKIEMLTLTSKNEIKNLEAIEKALKKEK